MSHPPPPKEQSAESATPHDSLAAKNAWLLVVVAALGYFVDIYDLLLFGIVRTASLRDIGVPDDRLLEEGVRLLDAQMGGLLLGGILWGILGDRRGRLSVLFASIFLYSAANIANGFVDDVDWYARMRFVAGVGLAGELGAGITLVSEVTKKETRGLATTLVATVGIAGAIVAALVGDLTTWRTAYFVGGGLGFCLLLLRVGVVESGLFQRARTMVPKRGHALMLLSSRRRLLKYLCVVFVAVPIWYVVGILVTFSPEIGAALGLNPAPQASRAILFTYAGLVVGDLSSGLLSQALRSRRLALLVYLVLTGGGVVLYFTVAGRSLTTFYAVCAAMGVATGYWAVFITTAAEQFGTNLRATATTTAPNFVRGMVVPLAWIFSSLKGSVGVLTAAWATGVFVLGIALLALAWLPETFGRDLDFIEE